MALPQPPVKHNPTKLLLSIGCGVALLLFIACLVFMRQEMGRLSAEPDKAPAAATGGSSLPVPASKKDVH